MKSGSFIAYQLYPGPRCPARSGRSLQGHIRIDPSLLACHHKIVTAKELQARAIVRTLRDHGFTAYLAGGCVRDKLLGIEPKDFDVATGARATDVQTLFAHTVPVGAQFGVVLVVLEGNPFEVATFRSDGAYFDGRHPASVHFSGAREDALRRDFTINGMFYDPVTEQVIDYVGGRQDLAAGIIHAIGDPHARFAEDRLRMLRAVRLAARLGFAIAPETFAAIQELAPTIVDIAWERIGDEVVKILTAEGARRAFTLLSESSLLRTILPETEAMRGVEQSPDFHPEGDVFVHTLGLLQNLPDPCPATLAWAALLHDVGKPPTFRVAPDRIRFDNHVDVGVKMAEEICRRLRFANDDTEQILALIANHMRFAQVPQMKDSTP